MLKAQGFVCFVLPLVLSGAFASPALSWVDPEPEPRSLPRFVPDGGISADGLMLAVSGTAMCGAGGVVQVAVSVLQQETLASARGFSNEVACAGAGLVDFRAEIVVPEERPPFAPGPAMVCALSQGRAAPDAAADYDQWCAFVTLVP
jgi:hypothetical protein